MINKTALQLSTVSGFIQYYYDQLPKNKTYKEAYETTEKEFNKHYGRDRYSSYQSFMVALNRYHKK